MGWYYIFDKICQNNLNDKSKLIFVAVNEIFTTSSADMTFPRGCVFCGISFIYMQEKGDSEQSLK